MGPSTESLEALRLYGEGYRPTSNKYRHAAKPSRPLRKSDDYAQREYTRRMNQAQLTLDERTFAELKAVCRRWGEK